MIELIFGTYGSGKTTEIFNRIQTDTENNKKCFLIIPDQEAVQFERLSLEKLSMQSQLNLEILSFSRLYNRLCRECGGISYSYITKPMRSVMMWKTLNDLKPLLVEYGRSASSDATLTDFMLSAVDEFKVCGITPTALENAASKLPESSPLATRLRDLALVYACFNNFVNEKYSDSADDLSRLNDMLDKHNFFSGANVYIDSFTSFTAVQHKIIDKIFSSADNTVISVPLCDENDNSISSDSMLRSYKKLKKSAESIGELKLSTLGENRRASSAAISYLSRNLWQFNNAENNGAPLANGSIIAEICDNPYAEAEAVAAHILDLLKKGARCKDIVIVSRDIEKYRGIIEPALANSSIPFFMSAKSDLCSAAPIKLILAALKIKRYNWRTTDVISYLKTGLCDIDLTDANLFEDYVRMWNISGNGFLDEPWSMNPDGFVKELSSRAEEILLAANRVKVKLTEPLLKLFVMLDAADNVADKCRAIYAFMQDISLEEKISALATKAAERTDIKQARELSRIYEIILASLADIAEILGDEQIDDSEFAHILKTVFDKTEIGSIPTSVDEVTVGSASMLRSSNQKYAFVIGLCEGEFPASVSESTVFSSADVKVLSELGIELLSDLDSRSSDELMYVERAFSIPSQKLYIFTHTSQIGGGERFPSLAFLRVEKIFSDVKPHRFDSADFNYLVPSPKNSTALLRAIEDSVLKNSLLNALEDYIPNVFALSKASTDNRVCSISESTLSRTFSDSMYFSPSSFEKYAKCPFSYYCSKILDLRESKNADFNAADMGTFIHFVLEQLLKSSIPSDPDEEIADDQTIIERTNQAVNSYIEGICPQFLLKSKRMQHLYSRLRSLSLLLIKNIVEEFSKSKFRPAFFELRANGKDGNPSPLVFKLADGTRVTFGGIVDRVDVYKDKENVYIRVVDYKTGTKNFSLDDIEYGINTQMLLYLFTLCRSQSVEFKKSIGCSDEKSPLPAGIVYLSANVSPLDTDDYEDIDSVLQKASKELDRSGLLLDNSDVLLAMNEDLDPNFTLGIKKASGEKEWSGDALASSTEFDQIYEQLERVIVKLATELRSGNAIARPLKYGNSSPCDYCSAKPICRNTNH